MPRTNKLDRYPDVVEWRKANPERNRAQNRKSGGTYRGEPGSQKRAMYNQAQRERAIRREARRKASKALARASEVARVIVEHRRTCGYTGALRPRGI